MNTPACRWPTWKHFFALRAGRSLPSLEADPACEQMPASLARSLAIFQLGESGGGTVIEQARRSTLPGVNGDFVRSLEYFVAEEHRHANLLAMCVRMLGGQLIRKNWTASLFVFVRRLMGLRLKIMVLLAAEVIGICYYRTIAEKLPSGPVRQLLLELAQDENAHLVFHADFLQSQLRRRWQRGIAVAAWRCLMAAARWSVLLDHRRAIRDLDIDRQALRALWDNHSRQAESLFARHAGEGGQPALAA